jgi:tetratricopeptide (TPR) repeat protein
MGVGTKSTPVFIEEVAMRRNLFPVIGVLFFLAITVMAQGIRGQIYLPNGAALRRSVRYTINTDDGKRNEILFTDSSGRIGINQGVSVPYSITVESDGETFDTTTAYFDPAYSRNYITIYLRPFTPKTIPPPGLVSVNNADQQVAPKAKENYESALKLIQAQQYEPALELLKKAIALQPDYFHAYNDLGVVYLKLNQLNPAADALRHAMKINPRIYLPQLNLAMVFNRQGKYREAADLLNKLDSSKADQALKINAPLVEALIGAQLWAQAEEALKKGLDLQGTDIVDLKIKLGMVLLKQNKNDAAIKALQEAIKLEPGNALAHFNLGTALFQVGQFELAESSLRRAYDIKGASMPGVQFLLGEIYYQKKDYPKAIEAFETYLRILPDAPNAVQVKEAIERLRKALKKS